MIPILRGTASRLGLRKPPRTYLYGRDGMEPDSLRAWVGMAPTVEEACVNVEQWRQRHLGGMALADLRRDYYLNPPWAR